MSIIFPFVLPHQNSENWEGLSDLYAPRRRGYARIGDDGHHVLAATFSVPFLPFIHPLLQKAHSLLHYLSRRNPMDTKTPVVVNQAPSAQPPMMIIDPRNALNKPFDAEGKRDFSHGLFACCDTPGLCCTSFWCPCCRSFRRF